MAEFFAAGLGAGKRQENVLDWSRLVTQAKSAPAEAWTAPEAFVAVLFSAVTCDEEVNQIEHEELLALAHRSRALRAMTPSQLGQLNAKVIERLRGNSEALGEACAALPEDARLPAFAHALDLVLADGELVEDEADFLNTLILHLKLNRDDVERVADVMVMKNQY